MQDRLAKVGGRPFVPPAEANDYSELEKRLSGDRSAVPQVEKKDYSDLRDRLSGLNAVPELSTPPAPIVPEIQSIPIPSTAYQSIPEALRTQPAKSNLSSVPVVPVEKPYQPVENELTSTYSTAPDAVEAPGSAFHSPRTAPQSKGRSSWLLWVGIALFVAFVIAQLIWVMS